MIANKVARFINISLILTLSLSTYCFAGAKDKKRTVNGTPVLWRQQADVASLNLLLGPGGEETKPDLSRVTFIKEDTSGTNIKYRVKDGRGREWVAKLGKEAQAETAATRFVWAAGYPTEITYLIPRVTIEGKGTFENVKFEARPEGVERLDIWSWGNNPFVGKPEFQGLKALMALLENWDIKDDNNKIIAVRNEATGETELHYIISDLGATFGKTGNFISRSRNKPEDYVDAKFIKGIKNNVVDFAYSGKRQNIFNDVTVEQARWIGERLAQLSDDQIRDAFRAANYSADEVEMLTKAVRARINELTSLQ
jgi:hypothetical protein